MLLVVVFHTGTWHCDLLTLFLNILKPSIRHYVSVTCFVVVEVLIFSLKSYNNRLAYNDVNSVTVIKASYLWRFVIVVHQRDNGFQLAMELRSNERVVPCVMRLLLLLLRSW